MSKGAERAFKVLEFQPKEKSEEEMSLEQSINDLVDIMRELDRIGKVVGWIGLPERVYLACSHTLIHSLKLAQALNERNWVPRRRDTET